MTQCLSPALLTTLLLLCMPSKQCSRCGKHCMVLSRPHKLLLWGFGACIECSMGLLWVMC